MHAEVYGDPTTYEAQYALVVYGVSSAYGNKPSPAFVTAHEISLTEKGPVIQAGVLADKAALRKLSRQLNPRAKNKPELLHTRTLAKGESYHLWWLPPAPRQVWFNTQEGGIGKRNGVTPQPGLVFMVSEKGWQVFAVKGKERPTSDTMLYRAPYLNVWESSLICTGSANLPKGKAANMPEAWEAPFFESEFTHTNYHGTKAVAYKGGIYALWKDLLDGKHKKFPERTLIQFGCTLQGLLDKLD